MPLGKKHLLSKRTYYNTYPTPTSALQIRFSISWKPDTFLFTQVQLLKTFMQVRLCWLTGIFHGVHKPQTIIAPSFQVVALPGPTTWGLSSERSYCLWQLMLLVVVTCNEKLSHPGCDKLKSLSSLLATSGYRKLSMPISTRRNSGCT